MVRIPNHCNHNRATTTLAHYRLADLCGIGMKPDDMIASWACSDCHDVADGRQKTEHSREAVRLMLAEGVFRTWDAIREMKRNGEI